MSLLHLKNYIIDKVWILISIYFEILHKLILAYQTNMETESTLSTSYLTTITICTLCNGVFVSLIIWVLGIIFRVCCQYAYKYISYFVSYYSLRTIICLFDAYFWLHLSFVNIPIRRKVNYYNEKRVTQEVHIRLVKD